MPAITAERLCPGAIFIPPDFARYRAVSDAVRAIFHRHTELVEPLSLDEAYLDVSHQPSGLQIAIEIKSAIRQELNLTASAGIAPNEYLAKIASDWKKPDGLFEIRPDDVLDFLRPLPVGKIPGVGKVTEKKLHLLGFKTMGDLRSAGERELVFRFGRWGERLYNLSYGVDHSEVTPNRPTKSVSAEDTLTEDQPLLELTSLIGELAERVWRSAAGETRPARTVVLKLKTSDFRVLTRSLTPGVPIGSAEQIRAIALELQARVNLPESTLYRLVGVGLSNFGDFETSDSQPSLF
jgi:DNA polymerase-4